MRLILKTFFLPVFLTIPFVSSGQQRNTAKTDSIRKVAMTKLAEARTLQLNLAIKRDAARRDSAKRDTTVNRLWQSALISIYHSPKSDKGSITEIRLQVLRFRHGRYLKLLITSTESLGANNGHQLVFTYADHQTDTLVASGRGFVRDANVQFRHGKGLAYHELTASYNLPQVVYQALLSKELSHINVDSRQLQPDNNTRASLRNACMQVR